MTALKFPRHAPRHGEDWIIDPAFLQRVLHSIEPSHPHEFTPTPEQVEVTLLSLEVIPISLYTSTQARKPWIGLTDEDIGAVLGFGEHTTASTRFTLMTISRAIEAKLKEKNT